MSVLFDDANLEYMQLDNGVITAVPFSVTAFIYKDAAVPMAICTFVDKDVDDHMFSLQYTSSSQIWCGVQGGAGVTGAVATTTGVLDRWTHAVAVQSAVNARAAYRNGGSKGTSSVSTTPVGIDRICIAVRGRLTPYGHASGMIQEVGVWNVALTDQEIAWLANGLRPDQLVARRGNLKGYYPCYNPDGRDYSGNNNHLTTIGGTPVRADHMGMLPLPPEPDPRLSRSQLVRRR